MEPYLKPIDKLMFYRYLDKAVNYFEYGSGGSTYQASIRTNIKSITSIESDLSWHKKLRSIIKQTEHVNVIYCEMFTEPNNWGQPGLKSTPNEWINYSSQIIKAKDRSIDLVLIDGRFRVACCLKCFDMIQENCYIIFDDFLDRAQYHIVLDYYEIIEKTSDTSMVILKKKKVNSPTKQLIEEYETMRD